MRLHVNKSYSCMLQVVYVRLLIPEPTAVGNTARLKVKETVIVKIAAKCQRRKQQQQQQQSRWLYLSREKYKAVENST